MLSLTWNCDGIPLFKSSKSSMWPIQMIVNELGLTDRPKNVLMCGMWIGKDKPSMDMYLKPFVQEMKKLGVDGFEYKNMNVKVYSAICCCDAVARCSIQNTHQFNGEFGCSLCLHEGHSIKKGSGYTRVYPVRGHKKKRTPEQMLKDATEAVHRQCVVNGVKGPSILSLLPKFNIVDGLVPEYMHCVILGVVRQLGRLWFDSSNHNEEFYIGQSVDRISDLLLHIKPPREAARLPRVLAERKFWKATEWRNFLFFSPIILKSFLPAKFLSHLWLLVYSIFNLTRSVITKDTVHKSHEALLKFVLQMEDLYGLHNISFNVHLLTHLCEYVENWGPLWASSAFVFESYNQRIKSFFRGTKGLPKQILKNYLKHKELHRIAEKRIPLAELDVQIFFAKLTCSSRVIDKAYAITDSCTGLGAPFERNLTVEEKAAIDKVTCLYDLNNPVKTFGRFFFKSMVIHSEGYSDSVKHNDSVVTIDDGKVAVILDMVIIRDHTLPAATSPVCLLIARELKPQRFSVFDRDINVNLAAIYKKTEAAGLLAFTPDKIKNKCLLIPYHGRTSYILEWPCNEFSD